jgi:hypothetical protein
MEKRGHIELTRRTFRDYKNRLRKMKGDRKTFYYAALPVLNRDAKRDVWVQADGTKSRLCF